MTNARDNAIEDLWKVDLNKKIDSLVVAMKLMKFVSKQCST